MKRLASLLLVASTFTPSAPAMLTATQREATSPVDVLRPTDWGPVPLTFQPFDTRLGTLNAVILSFEADIHVDYAMTFVAPATITLTTNDPRHGNTTGPQVTITGPTGIPLFVATQNPDRRQITAPLGFYSSRLLPDDPFFLPATDSHATLTSAIIDPYTLGLFSEATPVTLFATATAHSSFLSDSGNGGGRVTTGARANVALTYHYIPTVVDKPPAAVPEPPSGLAAALGMALVGAGVLYRQWGRPMGGTP